MSVPCDCGMSRAKITAIAAAILAAPDHTEIGEVADRVGCTKREVLKASNHIARKHELPIETELLPGATDDCHSPAEREVVQGTVVDALQARQEVRGRREPPLSGELRLDPEPK